MPSRVAGPGLQAGDRIGPLRIERPLGAGGMGEVWLARDQRLERLVAVKLLPSDRSLDPAARGRMLREARAASALKHPGIVTVYDIGEHDGRAYIVMEFVEGETFGALVRRRGRLSPAEAVDLLGQVVDAVAVAHAAGILHRDLKADNLMIDEAGRVKVLDFGLSKRTDGASQAPEAAPLAIQRGPSSADDAAVAPTVTPEAGESGSAATMPASSAGSPGPPTGLGGSARSDEPKTAYGARMGTPGWAPPELFDGRGSDVRSDVFSLGVVLYHMLCGRMPFPGTSWAEIREQIDRRPVRPSAHVAEVPAALDEVILAAVDPDAARRPETARALIARARAALVPPSRSPRVWLVAAGALVAAGGVAAIVLARGGDHAAPRAAVPTQALSAPDAAPPATTAVPQAQQITALGGCAYSPIFLDDDTIVFDLTRDGAVDLYGVDIGKEPERLTSTPGWEWRSVRGGTDREVVFLAGEETGNAVRLDLDTGKTTKLFQAGGPVVQVGDTYFYSPSPGDVLRRRQGSRDEAFVSLEDGSAVDTIVVSHDGSSLALLTFGDNQLAKVCVTPVAKPALRCLDAMAGSSRPSWSAAGDAVYVDGKRAINRVPVNGGLVTTAVPDVIASGGLAVAPSGARLAWSDCITKGQLVPVTTAGFGTPFVDEKEAKNPVFGPGGRFAYAAGALKTQRLMVRDPDGTLRERVRYAEARLTGLTFSQDGRYLAYVVGSRTEPGLYVVDFEGSGTPNRITEGDGDRLPLFVGDGLVFTRNDANGAARVMRVSLDGSSVEPTSGRPRSTIAVDHRRGRVLLASPGVDFLYWWDPVTGAETKGPTLPRPVYHVRISPNGDWLLAIQGENGSATHRLRLDGKSKLEKIYQTPGDVTSGPGAIDDDGNVVTTLFQWTGELWVLEAPAGSLW